MIKSIVLWLCVKFLSANDVYQILSLIKKREQAKLERDPVIDAILARKSETRLGYSRVLTEKELEIIKSIDERRNKTVSIFYNFD